MVLGMRTGKGLSSSGTCHQLSSLSTFWADVEHVGSATTHTMRWDTSCVRFRSAFSLASLPNTGNIDESICFQQHMQILICEHNYLLCMHKTDSLAHSVGIA